MARRSLKISKQRGSEFAFYLLQMLVMVTDTY